VPLESVVKGLHAFRAVAGRLDVRSLPSGARVIDDTYNANPDSVRAAIDVLAGAAGPRWLVLGDMGEVGAEGPAFHREIGAYAKERGIDRLLAAGELTREAVSAFGAGALHADSVEALAEQVRADAKEGVTLLVKGSRFMRMERVIAALGGFAAGGVH
jgi:UDP-N-acetylmuramoyl-tripeptide--D-alanyl-D-alanine ligase